MRKTFKLFKSVACIALAAFVALGVAAPAARADVGYLSISTAERFLQFAEDCRLDSYSVGMTVVLKEDIDLRGTGFEGVPTFGGVFVGGGHSISGLEISGDGSYKGLFRYIQPGAVVSGLTVVGSVAPGGSRSTVGGIAGENRGSIIACNFIGSVTGVESVGGIAGSNGLGGIIEGCAVDGGVHGTHFVGGIAGDNRGVIRGCTNTAEINTTPEQNSVDITDISLQSLTGSESVSAATDIGGIAGGSSGVIRGCTNRGSVGYKHMGYNIGGIAGSQSGYITGCINHGTVSGRKEVGGIVGQMEPMTNIEYQVDTLQMLKGELEELSELTGAAVSGAQGAAGSVSGYLGRVQGHVTDAYEAVEALIPNPENPVLPDKDALLAAQNALGSSLTGITSSISGAVGALNSLAGGLSSDMGAVMEQIDVISAVVDGAAENLGGTVTDISDLDTELDLTGKVADCSNSGDILADLNAGGIAGSVGVENDLDPEDDMIAVGDSSLNADCKMRAVILRCSSRGSVSAAKQNVGGVVGWASMGLVRDCFASGHVGGSAAQYVGGVAGQSWGYIRQSDAKATLTGTDRVGGIAGEGRTVTDCRSMVRIFSATERFGAVMGSAAEGGEVRGNYYLTVNEEPGAIDGISYNGCAQPLGADEFFALDGLDTRFYVQTVTFIEAGETVKTVKVVYGDSVKDSAIPAIEGGEGVWRDENGAQPGAVWFDWVYTAEYTVPDSVIAAQYERDGRPVLLAEGSFLGGDLLAVDAYGGDLPVDEDGETLDNMDSLSFTLPAGSERLHYLLPGGAETGRVQIYLLGADGAWRAVPANAEGSYLVFAAEPDDTALCLAVLPRNLTPIILAAAGGAVLVGAVIAIAAARKKKKPAPDSAAV